MPSEDREDQVQWVAKGNGKASVKVVYEHLIMNRDGMKKEEGKHNFLRNLWKAAIFPKWKIFIWKIMQNALAVKENLSKRGIVTDMMCMFCKKMEDSCSHLFRDCQFVAHI